jgi:hypothetical protein
VPRLRESVCFFLFKKAPIYFSLLATGSSLVAHRVDYGCFLPGEPKLRWFCAMKAIAAAYENWHVYFHSFTWEKLETACACQLPPCWP